MSRLKIATANVAGQTVESLYKDLERMILRALPEDAIKGSGGLDVMDENTCMVEVARFFMSFTQRESCGKCVPCRVGLGQLANLISDVLDGKADMNTLDTIEKLAKDINNSADCAIGYEAAGMVMRGLEGFKDD